MTPADFAEYRHRAVHKLMDLNAECKKNFRIGHWERWDYDLDMATLTFSDRRRDERQDELIRSRDD
jgi:hypothetical protein